MHFSHYTFLWTLFLHTSTYIFTNMLSSIYRNHSTAQHTAIRPAQSSKESTCRSERQDSSKQTLLARISTSSSIHHFVVFSKRTKKSNSAQPNVYNPLQSNLAGVMRELFDLALRLLYDLNKIQHCPCSPFPCNHRACMSSISLASGDFRSSIGSSQFFEISSCFFGNFLQHPSASILTSIVRVPL